MINRKQGPQIHTDFDLSIKGVKTSLLSNGIQLIELNTGTQEIIKIELVLKCGRIHESKVGASKAAILLMQEGSQSKNANVLAHTYDYFGASVKLSPGMEVSTINLVCMTKFFQKLWPTWLEMILDPAYSDEELNKFRTIQSQKLKNHLSKNEIISYRTISENIFGSDHPYGYNTEPQDIESLSREDVLDYFNNQISFKDAIIVISGKYDKQIKNQIIQSMSAISKLSDLNTPQFPPIQHKQEKIIIKTENEFQASIKVGSLLFERTHKDYAAFNFVNTILGGYFGSRLMTNIREEKGYTYGIYSMVNCWSQSGLFYISTDVSGDLIEPTIEEIIKEIDLLKKEPINEKEINMVKNYIMGQYLNMIDGPFATAQLVKGLFIKKLDIEYFKQNIEIIRNMTAEQVLSISNKYFINNNFSYVIVGGNNSKFSSITSFTH